MASTLVILDFDRTLLDPAFFEAFLGLLVSNNLLTDGACEQILEAITQSDVSLDLAGELGSCGVDLDAALDLARNHFGPDQFLYRDVASFLGQLKNDSVVIMTSGAKEWQKAKLSLCQSLQPYQAVIIPGNKGEHILAELVTGPDGLSLDELAGQYFDQLYLVDDRVDNLLPLVGHPNIKLWHILRPDAKYREAGPEAGFKRITSLSEVTVS